MGEDVLFICGSDCHGTPIVVNAEKEGITPKELVDRYHQHFLQVFQALSIEFDFTGELMLNTTTTGLRKSSGD